MYVKCNFKSKARHALQAAPLGFYAVLQPALKKLQSGSF